MEGRLCIAAPSGFTWSCRAAAAGRRALRGGRIGGWNAVG